MGWVANVGSAGADPGGRVLALNSGAALLPTRTPGLCWWGREGVSLGCGRAEPWERGGAYAFGGEGLVSWDAGVELAWLVADCVGVPGGRSVIVLGGRHDL